MNITPDMAWLRSRDEDGKLPPPMRRETRHLPHYETQESDRRKQSNAVAEFLGIAIVAKSE